MSLRQDHPAEEHRPGGTAARSSLKPPSPTCSAGASADPTRGAPERRQVTPRGRPGRGWGPRPSVPTHSCVTGHRPPLGEHRFPDTSVCLRADRADWQAAGSPRDPPRGRGWRGNRAPEEAEGNRPSFPPPVTVLESFVV